MSLVFIMYQFIYNLLVKSIKMLIFFENLLIPSSIHIYPPPFFSITDSMRTKTCAKNKSGLPNAFIWRTISNLEKKRKNRMKCLFYGRYKNNRWTNINPLPQWNHIWQTPGKNWTDHQKTRWSPRESKIVLRLSWQSVLGTDCRGYILKIVRIRQ